MKYFLIISCLLIIQSTAAEEKTLISKDVESGWFVASVNKFTSINDEMVHIDGWRLAWVANSRYNIGWTSYGLDDNDKTEIPVSYNNVPVMMQMDLHGPEFEYVSNPDELFHWTAAVHAGFGDLNYSVESADRKWDKDWVYFVEPSAHIEVNVFKWMRADLGASYRYVTGVGFKGLNNADVSGASAVLTFKFGSF